MTYERSESMRFNYYDLFFSYYFNNEISCAKMIHDHMLVYGLFGRIGFLRRMGKQVVVHKGECAFLRRDNRVNMTKQPLGEEQFSGHIHDI